MRSALTEPCGGSGGGDPGRALDPGIRRPLESFPQLARKHQGVLEFKYIPSASFTSVLLFFFFLFCYVIFLNKLQVL